jgi:acylphosphatase
VTDAAEWERVHVRIRGRVQGVGFRFSALEAARGLGLRGWVRNCIDDSVEAVAEGERDAVERFVDWCRHGPRGARVSQVAVEWSAPSYELTTFDIRS